MRPMGVLSHVPACYLLPVVLLVTLTAIYVQETPMFALWTTVSFGVLGDLFRRLAIPVLPFVIAYILSGPIARSAREAFAASGADPWVLLKSPLAVVFLVMSVAALMFLSRQKESARPGFRPGLTAPSVSVRGRQPRRSPQAGTCARPGPGSS